MARWRPSLLGPLSDDDLAAIVDAALVVLGEVGLDPLRGDDEEYSGDAAYPRLEREGPGHLTVDGAGGPGLTDSDRPTELQVPPDGAYGMLVAGTFHAGTQVVTLVVGSEEFDLSSYQGSLYFDTSKLRLAVQSSLPRLPAIVTSRRCAPVVTLPV